MRSFTLVAPGSYCLIQARSSRVIGFQNQDFVVKGNECVFIQKSSSEECIYRENPDPIPPGRHEGSAE